MLAWLQLFQAAHNAVGDPALKRELEGYITACNDFLGHEEAGPSSEQPPAEQQQQQQLWRRQQGFLFEGQLGSAAEPTQGQNPAEMLGSFLPPALAQQLLGQGEGGEGGGSEPPSAQALETLQQGACQPRAGCFAGVGGWCGARTGKHRPVGNPHAFLWILFLLYEQPTYLHSQHMKRTGFKAVLASLHPLPILTSCRAGRHCAAHHRGDGAAGSSQCSAARVQKGGALAAQGGAHCGAAAGAGGA